VSTEESLGTNIFIMMPLLRYLLHGAILTRAVLSKPDQETIATCEEILTAAPSTVVFPQEAAYKKEQANYWSAACKDAKPACIVLPSTPEYVSKALNVLQQHPNVKFAVKSGGHSPNVGHASMEDGVVIALARIKGTSYDRTTGLAKVKPGGQWADAIGALAPDGVTVVGGRLSNVGIGGYLTGGGLSFLSA
jgi:FAD/FMN-containing dehydrogenase